MVLISQLGHKVSENVKWGRLYQPHASFLTSKVILDAVYEPPNWGTDATKKCHPFPTVGSSE